MAKLVKSKKVLPPSNSGGLESEKYSNLEVHAIERAQKLQLEHDKASAALKREEAETELRHKFTTQILGIFVKANGLVLLCVAIGIGIDVWWGVSDGVGYLANRIFDKDVLIALIAAITVQLGAIAWAISKWLFR